MLHHYIKRFKKTAIKLNVAYGEVLDNVSKAVTLLEYQGPCTEREWWINVVSCVGNVEIQIEIYIVGVLTVSLSRSMFRPKRYGECWITHLDLNLELMNLFLPEDVFFNFLN